MTHPIEPGPRWTDPQPSAAELSRRGNRRRLRVFVVSALLLLALGQAWNFSRPVDYRSSLRLQLVLPDAGGADAAASATFGNRLQLIDSRPVLGRLAETLQAAGVPGVAAGEEGVAALQALLQVQPVAGSEVIELLATGPEPRLLATVLNALPDVLRAELASRQAGDADDRLQRAREELQRLETQAAERRQRLVQFRDRAGVLAEREDNSAVSSHRGLTTALNNAIEKETAAAARLRALTEAAAEGRTNTSGRQDGAVSALENRVSQVREELREMERSFTPAFMEMDPKARALRTRLAELERQLTTQREASRAAALQAAQEDLNGAQAQVARLRERQAAARPALGAVSGRLAEAKVLEDDLAQVEKARRELLERVARLESNERRRVAQVTVVEPAVVPGTPFSPDRVRDGLWVLGASLLLAALIMALVEVFNRQAAPAAVPATTVVLTPGWGGGPALAGAGAGAALPLPAAGTAAMAAPPPALAAPQRVLDARETLALLAATRGSERLACALGLMGLTPTEALALRLGDIDRAAGTLRVAGAWGRSLPWPLWLNADLPEGDAATAASRATPLLADATLQPLDGADLQAMLASAALDAGLPQGASLGWGDLRSTAIAWLLGQGLKFSELPARVGRVDAELLAALAERAAAAPRLAAHEVEPLLPALRQPPAAPAA
ncbi:hypothetical protein [Pseudorhodoferax sp.]|uniref:hypothetical protein n=1 Tax=Pseudorhodoferax sp. TaxID=1993553 RepID=UPI002DD67DFC|nr:hypothetical protein [Pseudorhodoferax sp.]